MSTDNFEHIVFIISITFAFGFGLVLLVGSVVYDLKQISLQKRLKAHPKSRVLKARPLVSIVISAEGSEDNLEKCLLSIAKNSYRKYEIIITNPNFSKRIEHEANKFKKLYPKKKIKIIDYRLKKNEKRITHYTEGQYILFISPLYSLEKKTIHNFVSFFALNPNAESVILAINLPRIYTISNLYSQFELSLDGQVQKLKSILGLKNYGYAVVYSRRKFFNYHKPMSSNYSANTIINLNSETTILSLLNKKSIKNLYAKSVIFAVVLLAIYSTYLAVMYKYTALLVIIWTISVYFLSFGIIANDQIKFFRKIQMLLLTPMISILSFFINLARMLLIQLPAHHTKYGSIKLGK
jgi:hypothetical protein